MDFFHDNQLRLNFGFDNPNHAAALIASLLPFLWLLGRLWTPARSSLRVIGWLASAALLLGGWYLLGLTVSRSGLLAAGVGFLWIGWRTFPEWKNHLLRVTALSLAVLCVVFATGALSRTMETVVAPDASATNRLTLWKGGLEMLALAPQGVGSGASGAYFMNWLQPVESDDGFRTMVNSFLTFFPEYGLALGTLTLFLAGAFILVFQPGSGRSQRVRNTTVASQASLIAFAVAGFFSTTIETAWVWMAPALAGILLVTLTLWKGRSSHLSILRALGVAALFSLVITGSLWGAGQMLLAGKSQSVVRSAGTLILNPTANTTTTIQVVPEVSIMGEAYGKPLRQLSESTRVVVQLEPVETQHNNPAAKPPVDWMMLAGEDIQHISSSKAQSFILLAPAAATEETATQLLNAKGKILLVLPGFDEDGRTAFWQGIAPKSPEKIQVVLLPEYGNNLTQAWPDIIHHLKSILSQSRSTHGEME